MSRLDELLAEDSRNKSVMLAEALARNAALEALLTECERELTAASNRRFTIFGKSLARTNALLAKVRDALATPIDGER